MVHNMKVAGEGSIVGLCNDEAMTRLLNPVVPIAKLDMKHLSYIILSF